MKSSLSKILFGLIALGCISVTSGLRAQTLKFTVQQTVNSNGSVTPTLAWCTELNPSPGVATCTNPVPATACTASGDWTGSKAGSGSQALTAVTTGKTYTLQCSWPGTNSIILNWVPPTQNDDGSTLTDLKGYKVYYGNSPTMSTNTIRDISNPGITTTTISPLAPGQWYLVMSAYNMAGVESVKSQVTQKTLSAAPSISHSVKVTFPNPPTNLTVE